jgi:hypothetical protein
MQGYNLAYWVLFKYKTGNCVNHLNEPVLISGRVKGWMREKQGILIEGEG